MSLHNKIINLPCDKTNKTHDYLKGHRDARHSAAELIKRYDELLDVALAMREYIDALPKDLILPAMPGFDRDWADDVIDRCKND